jgi:cytochrome d ubiquinol oxidase subunit II
MIDLPLMSALFIVFALALYVLLDGFDLGVGALLLLQRDESQRDRMVASITPTWDANETWLIMAGVGLLAGFPIAYGILLPALYLPVIIMLLSLGLRGVSFEFRIARGAHRRIWDAAFGVGSILAAAMQGLIVGGLIQGITVQGTSFAGSVWDCFRPSPFSWPQRRWPATRCWALAGSTSREPEPSRLSPPRRSGARCPPPWHWS